jgi:hypothetical protein
MKRRRDVIDGVIPLKKRPEGKFGLPIAFKCPACLMPPAFLADGNMLFGISLVAGTDNVGVCVMNFFSV